MGVGELQALVGNHPSRGFPKISSNLHGAQICRQGCCLSYSSQYHRVSWICCLLLSSWLHQARSISMAGVGGFLVRFPEFSFSWAWTLLPLMSGILVRIYLLRLTLSSSRHFLTPKRKTVSHEESPLSLHFFFPETSERRFLENRCKKGLSGQHFQGLLWYCCFLRLVPSLKQRKEKEVKKMK